MSERFQALHETHPRKTLLLGAVRWSYLAVGKGPEGAQLLPGALGSGEAYVPLLGDLTERLRLVMIDYPLAGDLEELLLGLTKILDPLPPAEGNAFLRGGRPARYDDFEVEHYWKNVKLILRRSSPVSSWAGSSDMRNRGGSARNRGWSSRLTG